MGACHEDVQKRSGQTSVDRSVQTGALGPPGSLEKSLHMSLSCVEGFSEAIRRATFHAAQTREAP